MCSPAASQALAVVSRSFDSFGEPRQLTVPNVEETVAFSDPQSTWVYPPNPQSSSCVVLQGTIYVILKQPRDNGNSAVAVTGAVGLRASIQLGCLVVGR